MWGIRYSVQFSSGTFIQWSDVTYFLNSYSVRLKNYFHGLFLLKNSMSLFLVVKGGKLWSKKSLWMVVCAYELSVMDKWFGLWYLKDSIICLRSFKIVQAICLLPIPFVFLQWTTTESLHGFTVKPFSYEILHFWWVLAFHCNFHYFLSMPISQGLSKSHLLRSWLLLKFMWVSEKHSVDLLWLSRRCISVYTTKLHTKLLLHDDMFVTFYLISCDSWWPS